MPEIQVNIKIKQQVVVVGDSFLWRMEGLICQSHLMSKRACYLPEAQIPDDMERLLRLVQPLDYYMSLFIHVGTSGTVRGVVNHIKNGFRALVVTVKAMGA